MVGRIPRPPQDQAEQDAVALIEHELGTMVWEMRRVLAAWMLIPGEAIYLDHLRRYRAWLNENAFFYEVDGLSAAAQLRKIDLMLELFTLPEEEPPEGIDKLTCPHPRYMTAYHETANCTYCLRCGQIFTFIHFTDDREDE